MAGLVEHSILNGIDNDLVNAIESVGGDTSEAVGVVDLANVIRTQLISKDIASTDWLFGGPETNNVWEEPTTSTSSIQAKVTAQSIKQLYDLMINSNRFLIRLVDKLPEVVDLNTTYLLKQEIQETNTGNIYIDISRDHTTFEGSIGRIEQTEDIHVCCEIGKPSTIMTITPSAQGEVSALFGWDGFNYKVENYDGIVIKTNVISWGPTGIQYSLNGIDFYDVTSDYIKISKDQLNNNGISNINRIIFKVDSVNNDSTFARIKIEEIYFEKTKNSYIKYTAHHYVQEGDSFRRIDFNDININFDDLFYATREDLVNSYSELNRYYSVIEDTLKEQLGHYMEDGNLSLKDTIDSLQNRILLLENNFDNINVTIDNKLASIDSKLEEVEEEVNVIISEKIHEIDNKLAEVDTEFDTKFQEIDTKLVRIDAKLTEFDTKFIEVGDKFDIYDQKLESFITKDSLTDATEEKSGLMSAEDKKKLNSIEAMPDDILDKILTL